MNRNKILTRNVARVQNILGSRQVVVGRRTGEGRLQVQSGRRGVQHVDHVAVGVHGEVGVHHDRALRPDHVGGREACANIHNCIVI